MAQHYDVPLKLLFLSDGDGIVRRLLFGGKITEFLSTEQPQILNRRADILARSENGTLNHIEFQAFNEFGFELRMLEYYAYLLRTHNEHVVQTVLWLGAEPLRLKNTCSTPTMTYKFDIVNLRELDAAPLLASSDWVDNVLALLAKGEPKHALEAIVNRLRAMPKAQRSRAAGIVFLLSGILGIERSVGERLKEIDMMIDVMQNKVLGPLILAKEQEAYEKGLSKGELKGERKGERKALNNILQDLLTEKFGPLPKWAKQRMKVASESDLRAWGKRLLSAPSLEETLS